MKEIKVENKREIVETTIQYQASDGTTFFSKEECEKYEDSAAAMLLAKLKGCEIASGMDTDWFDCSEDNQYRTLCPSTQEDIDTMNQLWFLFGGKGLEAKFHPVDIGKLVLMGVRIYDEAVDYVWFYKFDYIMEQMTAGKYIVTKKP